MEVAFDRVLIKRQKKEQISSGGILIPDFVVENEVLNTGTIEGVGEDCKKTWKLKQFVIFNKHSPAEITVNGEDFIIMKETDIYGIL